MSLDNLVKTQVGHAQFYLPEVHAFYHLGLQTSQQLGFFFLYLVLAVARFEIAASSIIILTKTYLWAFIFMMFLTDLFPILQLFLHRQQQKPWNFILLAGFTQSIFVFFGFDALFYQ